MSRDSLTHHPWLLSELVKAYSQAALLHRVLNQQQAGCTPSERRRLWRYLQLRQLENISGWGHGYLSRWTVQRFHFRPADLRLRQYKKCDVWFPPKGLIFYKNYQVSTWHVDSLICQKSQVLVCVRGCVAEERGFPFDTQFMHNVSEKKWVTVFIHRETMLSVQGLLSPEMVQINCKHKDREVKPAPDDCKWNSCLDVSFHICISSSI